MERFEYLNDLINNHGQAVKDIGKGWKSIGDFEFFTQDDEGNEVIDTVINTGLTPTYLRINEEIRWTLPWKNWRHWQIVQFYDWTRVMDNERDVYKEAAMEALGLGLRYHWQFLTFRLDYAFKKNLSDWSPEGFAWGRFAFDLSQTF